MVQSDRGHRQSSELSQRRLSDLTRRRDTPGSYERGSHNCHCQGILASLGSGQCLVETSCIDELLGEHWTCHRITAGPYALDGLFYTSESHEGGPDHRHNVGAQLRLRQSVRLLQGFSDGSLGLLD
jgi:hypothetical protein